jgi:hypothetical protein
MSELHVDKDKFFGWCAEKGLDNNRAIAMAILVSSQTIRNWRKREDGLPAWLALACKGYEKFLASGQGPVTNLPKVTVLWFDSWQRENGIGTYEDLGVVFGLSRQAVHNWVSRGRFPRWVALACLGYEPKAAAEESATEESKAA